MGGRLGGYSLTIDATTSQYGKWRVHAGVGGAASVISGDRIRVKLGVMRGKLFLEYLQL